MEIVYVFVFRTEEKEEMTLKEGGFMSKKLEELSGLTAEQLLRKYNVSLKPPINLNKLIENIGISAYSLDFSDVEDSLGYVKGEILGAVISDGDDLDILYAKGLSDNRSRFTVAHELAHCCTHTQELMSGHIELRKDNDEELSKKEYDANIFAGELLIPKESLVEVCSLLIKPTITSLAEIFQVSANVMRARLEYLNLLDSIIDMQKTHIAEGNV